MHALDHARGVARHWRRGVRLHYGLKEHLADVERTIVALALILWKRWLRTLAQRGQITLVFSAHDEAHNDAVVLRELLLGET